MHCGRVISELWFAAANRSETCSCSDYVRVAGHGPLKRDAAQQNRLIRLRQYGELAAECCRGDATTFP